MMKTKARQGEKTPTRSLFAVAWVIVIGGLMLFMLVQKPEFFTVENIKRILIQTSSTGIMAFGLTFVLITGRVSRTP